MLTLLGLGITGASCGGNGKGGGTGGFACDAGATICGSSCANLSADPLNCGACGTVCSSVKAGSKCQSGACLCPPGQGPCGLQNPSLPMCVANTDAMCGNSCIACTGGTKCKNGSCLWPVLTLVPTKSTYASGEQIVINVTYTNPTPAVTPACSMIKMTMGNLTIGSMTLDGKPVLPTTTRMHFDGGMTNSLLNNLAPVAPQGSVSMLWKSEVSPAATFDRYTLETISLGDRDVGDVVQWPVKSPGTYALIVNYAPPATPAMPANLCHFMDTASVGFVVSP